MNIKEHPCFNATASRKFGRIHVPVAPCCNVQCKFCSRKYDCINESRPGVTSVVLSAEQAADYATTMIRRKPYIRVVGIAGPGDAFASPERTLETLERIRCQFPEIMLCIATNGLNLTPYLDDIIRLRISHVTITVNAVDPEIGAKIYRWIKIDSNVLVAEPAARALYERQRRAIQGLKDAGITVKINSILIPNINDHHMLDIAKEMGCLGVDRFNCMPCYPCPGSELAEIEEPSSEIMSSIHQRLSRYVTPMRHCKRCRADAVGLLSEAHSPDAIAELTLTLHKKDGKNLVSHDEH